MKFRVGINHLQEPVQRPNGTPIYQWFYCEKGTGEMIINHQKSILRPGQGMLIYPNVPHTYYGVTGDWTLHIFGFQGPSCSKILKSLGMHESAVYHFSNPDIFSEHIQKLYEIHQTKMRNKQPEYSKECYAFLLDLSFCINRIHTTVPGQENKIIQKIIAYLEENYIHPISLDDLAAHVQLSKEYMCTLFKKYMHQTIVHFLTGIRISRARILLNQYPEKKVLEIAEMCGFESPSYFGMIFKKETGVTPENYRKIK